MPSHGKRLAAIEHPRPVDAVIDFCGKILDFLIGKILTSGKNTAKENGRIDRRKFALFPANAGFHVNEMKKEAVFVMEIVGDKTQRVSHTLGDFRRLSVSAMVAE